MFVCLNNFKGIGYFLMPLHAIITMALKLFLFFEMAPSMANLMIEEKKTHNMLSLILNPRFKSPRLVSSFIG
jgi:hypothetical protein